MHPLRRREAPIANPHIGKKLVAQAAKVEARWHLVEALGAFSLRPVGHNTKGREFVITPKVVIEPINVGAVRRVGHDHVNLLAR